jgi:hypothetical protein
MNFVTAVRQICRGVSGMVKGKRQAWKNRKLYGSSMGQQREKLVD